MTDPLTQFPSACPRRRTILLTLPFLSMGGAEAVLSRICRHLKKLGYRIFIITTLERTDGQGDSTAWFQDSATALYDLPQAVEPDCWSDFLLSLIRENAINILWQVGSSFVYDILWEVRRAFPSLAIFDLLFNPVGHTADFLRCRELIDHVVTEHEGMKNWLLEHGVAADKISVIPNGVDLEEFSPQPKRSWSTGLPRSGDGESLVAAFIGRLSEEKGPDLFLDIAAQFRSDRRIEFLLCGVGRMEKQLIADLVARGLSGHAHVLGFVPTREALAFCDLVVVCSRMDGRPNLVLESLAAGVPVIASRVGGIPDMLPPGSGGIHCEPGDTDAFAAAIRSLFDARVRGAHASAARAHAERCFSIAESIRQYDALFEAVVERRIAEPSVPVAPPKEVSGSIERPGPMRRVMGAIRMVALLCSPSRLGSKWKNAFLLWRLHRTGANPSAAFDRRYYLRTHRDVARAAVPPFLHYVFFGFREGRNPSARFRTDRYLAAHPDVARSGVNPLLHAIASGAFDPGATAPLRRQQGA